MHTHAQEIRLKVSLNEYIMHHPPRAFQNQTLLKIKNVLIIIL